MNSDLRLIRILPFQHFIVAVLLGFIVACSPALLIPWNWNWEAFRKAEGAVARLILWFIAFGLIGFFWMIFESRIPPYHFTGWFIKIIRGIFIWGPILGILIYYLPAIFNVTDPGFHDSAQYIIIFSILMGFILSVILSIYSYFFIRFS